LPVNERGSVARRDLDRLERLSPRQVNFTILGPEWETPGHRLEFHLWMRDGNNVWQPFGGTVMHSGVVAKGGVVARAWGFFWAGDEGDVQGEIIVTPDPFEWGLSVTV
jgi:hypothetical protein